MAIKYRLPDGETRTVDGQLFTGIVDRNGVEIYEGDTLRFVDKWEWWRCSLGFVTAAIRDQVLNDHEKYPYEERTIELPTDYDWLLSKEVQTYWEIVK